CQQYNSLPFTL
nr:immunoglobulin light chain junction region [Macaca mulatta]